MAESRPPELPLAAIRDLLRWLKAAQVQGVVIGGVAVSIQGHARYTRDLDALEFEEELIGRATIVKLGRLKVPVAGPEDLIILKAIAMRPRDLGDIDSILQPQPRLDLARIRRIVAEFAGILEQPEIIAQIESLLKRDKKRGKR